jgi:GNAT superfamily N-acetyltransferase
MNIRNYQNGDEIGVNNLHNSVYSANRTLSVWEWEFKENPLGRTIFVITEDNGEIKGSQSLIPAYLNIRGEKIYSAKSEATLLHPDYRGKNLFSEMYKLAFDEARKDNIKIIWGFTNAVKSFGKIGFSVTMPISLMWYVNNIGVSWRYLLRKHIAKSRYKIIKSIAALSALCFLRFCTIVSGLFSRSPKSSGGLDVKPLDGFNKETDMLFDDFIDDFPDIITLWRNQEDFEWRTMSNPAGEKHIFGLFAENKLTGYAVIIFNKEDGILTLQDIIVRKQYLREGTICLLNKVKAFARKVKAGLIRNMLVASESVISNNNKGCFSKTGFCMLPNKTATVIKVMDDRLDKDFILDIDNWYITGLFTEGF